MLPGGGRSSLLERETIENGTFCPEFSVIDQICTSPDEFAWVRRQNPGPMGPCRAGRARTAGDDGSISVFDPEGNCVGPFPRGGMRMPQAFGPDGPVAYWDADELDILSVAVYRPAAKLRR